MFAFLVMVKASAGGGGKGMRIAWNDKEAMYVVLFLFSYSIYSLQNHFFVK